MPAFCAEMEALIAVPVRPPPSSQEAVQDADIVICATNSTTPVIDARCLREGGHVNTVGPKSQDRHELGLDVAERAATIATDAPEQTVAYDAPFFLAGTASGARMVDWLQLLVERDPHVDTETTLFCSVGLAGTEVLVAARAMDQHRGP